MISRHYLNWTKPHTVKTDKELAVSAWLILILLAVAVGMVQCAPTLTGGQMTRAELAQIGVMVYQDAKQGV